MFLLFDEKQISMSKNYKNSSNINTDNRKCIFKFLKSQKENILWAFPVFISEEVKNTIVWKDRKCYIQWKLTNIQETLYLITMYVVVYESEIT